MYLWVRVRPICRLNLSGTAYRCSSICLYSYQPDHLDMNKEEVTHKKVTPVNETDFYADWCGPCNMIAPTIEALSDEYEGKVKFVKINVDNNQQLVMKYDIMSIPTGMLFENGIVKDSLIGAYPASAYRERIDHALGPRSFETGTSTARQ